MRLRNFLGVAGALFFASFAIYAAGEGAWRSSLAVVMLWFASAYWRRGEGLDDSYNKQQSFIAAGFYGLMGLVSQRLGDIVLPEPESTVLIMYTTAASFVMVRLLFYANKQGALVFSTPNAKGLLNFFLFQQPEQVRKHTQG